MGITPAIERETGGTIDAILRHLAWGQDLQNFPGTMSEKLALVRTASRRGLIAWRKSRGRYELTSIGWSKLTPRRLFSFASLTLSAAAGAAMGATALAFLLLPADGHRSVRGQSTTLVSQLESPITVSASRWAGASNDARPIVERHFACRGSQCQRW